MLLNYRYMYKAAIIFFLFTLIVVSAYYLIMAEKVFTASDALKQLDQQLTCPVCLERYTHPRTLPCLHSFCHQCLGHFPVNAVA